MDRGTWGAPVHGVSKNQTSLSDKYYSYYEETYRAREYEKQ